MCITSSMCSLKSGEGEGVGAGMQSADGQVKKGAVASKSLGTTSLDVIPVIIGLFKKLCPGLCPISSTIFLTCVETRNFPSSWKIVSAVQVPKKDATQLSPSYRPISFLLEIFEALINKAFVSFLESHYLLLHAVWLQVLSSYW